MIQPRRYIATTVAWPLLFLLLFLACDSLVVHDISGSVASYNLRSPFKHRLHSIKSSNNSRQVNQISTPVLGIGIQPMQGSKKDETQSEQLTPKTLAGPNEKAEGDDESDIWSLSLLQKGSSPYPYLSSVITNLAKKH